jgi:competence protein ComEC
MKDWRSWYFLRRPVLWSLALFCGGLAGLKQQGFFAAHAPSTFATLLGERVCVNGIVNDQPDQWPSGCVLPVQLETLTLLSSTGAVTQSRNEQVMVYALGRPTSSPWPGDRIRACGAMHAPASPMIPGVFDYAEFLANRQVQGLIYTGGASLHNWGDSGRFRCQRWGWKIKRHVIRQFEKALSPEQTAVMAGLVVGQRPRFHPELKEIFLRSGTMHVLVASGSNIAFVILMWFAALRGLRVPSRWALASALAPMWLYVLVSGGDAPLVRAAIMGSTMILSHLLRRWDRPFNALGLAAWIILIANPRSLFDLGFQMSFLTVTGLILTLPAVEFLGDALPNIFRWPLRILAASVIAELWLIPVCLHSLHYLYPFSIFSNMVVVPSAEFGLPLGVAVTVCGWLGPLVRLYAQTLLWLVGMMALHLGMRWWLAPLPFAGVIGYYTVCLSLPKIRISMLARFWLAIGVMVFAGAQWVAMRHAKKISGLSVTWINTGRVLSTLVETPSARFLFLPDRAAVGSNVERILLPYIATERKRPITAMLLESPDFATSPIGKELRRTCSISTVNACAAPVAWAEAEGRRVLFATVFTLRVQRYLARHMKDHPDVIAAHFPPHWKWDDEFVERFKPKIMIETGSPRKGAGNNSPWPDVPIVTPQKLGLYTWPPPTREGLPY